ncbi:hypothetical protein ACFOEE_05780 [Pseudoalteromonas fenneropenaei]|uniref:PDZ domain-containing protein n=1 Tax=Pseudoalteromonas fenneropenaei TaxID=1737459 RepID=A0ABV7CHK8_9GAMM
MIFNRRVFFIAVLFFLGLPSPVLLAQDLAANCARLATSLFVAKSNEFEIGLISHNGILLNGVVVQGNNYEYSPIILNLQPGRHHFTGSAYRTAFEVNFDPLEKVKRSVSKNGIFEFIIEVEAGKAYRIAGVGKIPKGSYIPKNMDVIVKSKKDVECLSDDVLPALSEEEQSKFQKELPEELQFQLDYVVNNIKNYYLLNSPDIENIEISKSGRGYFMFGLLFGLNQFEDIVVLDVIEKSFASKFKFENNDVVVSVNNKDIKGKEGYRLLVEELEKLRHGGELSFSVLRKNKQLRLSHNLEPSIALDYNLQLNLQ